MIESWLGIWQTTWNVPDLASRIRIEYSPRMRSALGRCHPADARIRLNPRLLQEPEPILREVVCHEAAHVAVSILHGRRVKPHGPEWRRLMRAAGYEPRARMDPRRLSPAFHEAMRPRTLYLHRCPICGAARTARRRFRSWRCRRCYQAGLDGALEITSLGRGAGQPPETAAVSPTSVNPSVSTTNPTSNTTAFQLPKLIV